MSQKHNISVNKTASYYTLGDSKTATTIWFVLHGYGYLAKYFINKFTPILNDNTCVIAPEALSKFYLNGVGVDGRVGASWMTKEDRENEIIDYINYLNQLFNTILNENNNPNIKINIVGFSQGGATASRWISNGNVQVNNFILWSSVFPDDMNFEKVNKVNTHFLYGNNDEYVTEDRVLKQQQIIASSEININTIVFNGNHDIPEAVLLEQTKKNNWA